MKKIILMAAAMIGFATAASAQTFENGTNNITATLGFGGGYGVPVALSYERGVLDFAADHKLGVGGYIGFGDSYFFPAAECNYHYVGVNKLDLYGGVRLGFLTTSNGSATSSMGTSFDIGANYYFSSNWAINAEIGTGLGALNLGATYRF
ncbi:MAG: hypothetical protein SNG38_00320 [Rikenellaceae bacterium]